VLVSLAVLSWVLSIPSAHAADVGTTTDALPGIVRVPAVGSGDRAGVSFAGSAGYGYTEGVLHEGDAHHRAYGSLAASYQPIPLVAVGLRLDGRYDAHTGQEQTHGWIGDPRLAVRLGGPVARSWYIGGQLGVWFPGASAPSWVVGSTTPDASLLATFAPEDGPLAVAARAGVRWDNSTQSASNADRLARSDRLSLGLNQASAALFGLGLADRVTPRVEVIADGTWDLLVGSGAPSALKSPIVLEAGARISLDPGGRFQLEAVATASPSERPPIAAGSPLVNVEPLVGGFIALVIRPALPARTVVPEAPPVVEHPAAAPQPQKPAVAALHGVVTSEDAHAPVARAHVAVHPARGAPREADTGADGAYAIDDLDPGDATVEISADGYAKVTRSVALSAGPPLQLDLGLPKALPEGQVRGLVRDFSGKPLVASIRVEPAGLEVKAAADGTFEVNVPPGSYQVVIHAAGFADQRRRVTVERDGVTMLNVELRKGR
jgi:hypothetical protein